MLSKVHKFRTRKCRNWEHWLLEDSEKRENRKSISRSELVAQRWAHTVIFANESFASSTFWSHQVPMKASVTPASIAAIFLDMTTLFQSLSNRRCANLCNVRSSTLMIVGQLLRQFDQEQPPFVQFAGIPFEKKSQNKIKPFQFWLFSPGLQSSRDGCLRDWKADLSFKFPEHLRNLESQHDFTRFPILTSFIKRGKAPLCNLTNHTS